MMTRGSARTLGQWVAAVAIAASVPASAQTIPFTSGPIPPCDTSTFTATVSGIGFLVTPSSWSWGYYLEDLLVNITSTHPQTLQISLTSPQGTTLLLSAFNGAGGQNYTNTHFTYYVWNNITASSAPFTNYFWPQGGTFEAFTGQNADGIWTITVIDTACGSNGPDPGGTWSPGWFQGGTGSGAFAFGFSSPPPPCLIDMGLQNAITCGQVQPVDLLSGFQTVWFWDPNSSIDVYDPSWNLVPPPYVVSNPGTYYIYVYDWMAGCTYDGSVYVAALPEINLGPDQVVTQCDGAGPVNLTALFNLTGATSHNWTRDGAPITNAMATNATTPGVYVITAMNNGCNDVAQVTLSNAAAPVLGPDQALTICEGSSADLTILFDTQGLAPVWSVGGSIITPPSVAASPATYTISVTTADGCTDAADVVLSVQPLPDLGPDQSAGLCSGTTADLTAFFATDGLNTTWTLNGNAVADPTAITTGGNYDLMATDALGCADFATAVITDWASPALGADAAAGICAGESVDLTSYFNTNGLAANWTLGGAAVANPAAVNAAGTYILTVADANGCSDGASVVVTLSANPVLGPDQQVTACDGTTVDLTTLYATGANATSWTTNGVAVPNANAVASGGAYTITVTNAANCSATAVVTVSFNPSPALGADVSAAICEGTSFDLTTTYSTNGLTAIWSLNGSAVADASAVAEAGSYELVVSNAFNCTDTAWCSLAVNNNPSLGDDLAFTLCPWQSVDFTTVFPVVGLNASFTLNGLAIADPTAVADSGAYIISVTDAAGCADEAMAMVTNIECLCAADFEVEARCLQEPARFTLLADSAVVSSVWDFGGAAGATTITHPEVLFEAEELVRVTLEVELTCGTVVVERMVPIVDCSDSCRFWVPNAFTPNNDTENDVWIWRSDCLPTDFTALVFNRWGEVVYATTDPLAGWDGSYAGIHSPDDVYVYKIGYRLLYQDRREVVGHVVLLR
ncbi:MAG TPA: gliding motility-associated C-terminal domain-containing protein [Flavobacteriales bacterium]|nr:gliding motility-associated C-terminal domain-containing protein [Flavobacteriales bacterium]